CRGPGRLHDRRARPAKPHGARCLSGERQPVGRSHKLAPHGYGALFAARLVGAATHSPCLELVDEALVAPPVEHQPEDEDRNPNADRGIGAPDVSGVWPKVHAGHSAGWRAKSTLVRTW